MPFMSFYEDILCAAITAVTPDVLIEKCLKVQPKSISVCGHEYKYNGKLFVFGFGKAATGFVRNVVKLIGSQISSVVCCTPLPTTEEVEQFPNLFSLDSIVANNELPRIEVFHGPRTNEPDEEVVKASLRMAHLAISMKSEDLLLICITGGGSAMLTLPETVDTSSNVFNEQAERIPLDNIKQTSRLLSLSGASIQEINIVRSCLDAMKFGGLARFAAPARVVSLILSDVIGDPVEFIASGPTYHQTTGFHKSTIINAAKEVISKYNLMCKLPVTVRHIFEHYTRNEQSGVVTNCGPEPENHIIGNIGMALNAACFKAAEYPPVGICCNSILMPRQLFPRTPVSTSSALLPIILTNSLRGDMQEKADAIADLSWVLRLVLIDALRDKDFCVDSINIEKRELIQNAHNRLIKPNRDSCNDLLQACIQVANLSKANKTSDIFSSSIRAGVVGLCLLFGGEATVKIDSPAPGDGGRCSHAALRAALRWFELRNVLEEYENVHASPVDIGLLARATDGLDGPAAFGAGAWSCMTLLRDEHDASFATDCLASGNSYSFYKRYKNPEINPPIYLPTRLTGTNVMDIFMCLISIDCARLL